ncbi:cation-translocating P-type ATPase [Massilia sp. Se16.2.3]|uniref:heavy metal translocating P-type ATPase n=1 Tax=Massilia sp. Se16.2.3 TaxID=2709303 RepID=UPI001E2C98DB|nr:heavy metal translocating P-type ATPase [Massilia sp. Se16.2.3]
MDVPVAPGIAAAFGGSTLALVRGEGALYFDSVTMFVFLLLASRYLELSARRRAASALEALQAGLPASSRRMARYPIERAIEVVAASSLVPGDIVLVAAGEQVPADGVIVEGETEVDFSLLTGESRTRCMAPGDKLAGGAVNVARALVMRVEAAARESTLALLVRLAEKAGQGKPALALWADRAAAWSVAALLVLTVLVFATWQLIDPARAWPAAIAVLVVTCPCALSLAMPTALAAAHDGLLRRGVLAVGGHALETPERATHVVFDKTGTLTLGRPWLDRTRLLGTLDEPAVLRLAAALEAGNAHPLALAIRANVPATGALQAQDLHYTVGRGIEGKSRAAALPHRQRGLCRRAGGQRSPFRRGGTRRRGLAGLGELLAGALRHRRRAAPPEAAEVVRRFEAAGKMVVLLSGDEPGTVGAIAARLGIRDAVGGQLPEQKLAHVRRLQESGAIVAMVGDGINDAAVLRGADVSFAMGGGAALAQLNADCVLLGEGLLPLGDAADTARRTLRVVRQNLAWASVYNLVAIPLAATGLLNPLAVRHRHGRQFRHRRAQRPQVKEVTWKPCTS